MHGLLKDNNYHKLYKYVIGISSTDASVAQLVEHHAAMWELGCD